MNRRKSGTRYCSAVNCSNSRQKNADLSFFRFPKDEERCKVWVHNCGRLDLETKDTYYLSKSYQLCANHFQDSQFNNSTKKKLVFNAVPTIFPSEDPPVLQNHTVKICQPSIKKEDCSSTSILKSSPNTRRHSTTQITSLQFRRNWGKSLTLERWRNDVQKARKMKQASGQACNTMLPLTYEGLLMKYRGLEKSQSNLKSELDRAQTELKECKDQLASKSQTVLKLSGELESARLAHLPESHVMEKMKRCLLPILAQKIKTGELMEHNVELPEWTSELTYGGLIAFLTLLQYQKEN